jgi:NAD(P)-dependent dehydrogenase (short-subunit alcohol dehydrogenase family)
LWDKIAVVTGGAQGIGQAIVTKFHAEGAKVALLDIDEPRGRDVVAALGGPAAGVLFLHCDITREANVERAMAETIAAFGGLDILINNAGVNTYFDATTMTEEEWERVFAVDLKGAWLCAKHALPAMRERGSGSIVNIASLHAFMTTYGMFPYAADKSGLVGMTRSLALDFGPEQIRVNAICPGIIETRMKHRERREGAELRGLTVAEIEAEDRSQVPLGRTGTPQDVAGVALFLASDLSSYMTGQGINVTGGMTMH